MIPPVIDLSEKLNYVSSRIDQLNKKIHRYQFIITAIDTKLKETACLAAEVAFCQLEIIQNLLNIPSRERDFSIIQDSLDEKLKKVREDYLDNYNYHLLAQKEYIEDGQKKILTDDKSEELKNEFAKKMDEAISFYKNKTDIDENSNLNIIKSHLEEKIIKTQEIYDALFKEKKNLTKEQNKQMSSISSEYNQLLEEKKNMMRELKVTDIYSATQVGAMDFVIKKIDSLYFFNKRSTLNRLDNNGFSPLHYAAYHNRFDILMLLLEQGASCLVRDSYGYQPLHWAAKQGVYAIVRTLIEHNAPINGKGEYGRTPLHMAVFNGKIATTILLLDKRANINSQTSQEDNQKTPLHDAVIHGDAGMVKALVKYSDLNVNLTDSMNHTPLYYAIADGLLDIAELIMKHSSYSMPLDSNNPNHIDKLITLPDVKIPTITFLLNKGANINSQTSIRTPLHNAVIRGDIEMVAILVGYSDLNVNLTDSMNHTPLYYAISDGHVGIAKLITEHPSYSMPSNSDNPNHIDKLITLPNGKIPSTIFLLEKGANINSQASMKDHKRTALHNAVIRGDIEMVSFLIEHSDLNVNLSDSMNHTPLYYAIENGHVDIAKLITELPSYSMLPNPDDPNHIDKLITLFNGKIATTTFLLENGANINSQASVENHKKTLLHDAVIRGDTKMVELLVKYSDLNVNLTDSKNHAPLYYAISYGFVDIAELIIKHPSYSMPSDSDDPNHISKLITLKPNNANIEKLLKSHFHE